MRADLRVRAWVRGGVVAAHLLGVRAVVLGLDVLALELVHLAAREVVGHDSNVLPPRVAGRVVGAYDIARRRVAGCVGCVGVAPASEVRGQ